MREAWNIVVYALPYILRGLVVTLYVAALSLLLGFLIGVALGLSRFYGGKLANAVSVVYGRIMRSIPPVVMVMMLYLVFQSNVISLSPIASVVLALGLHSGAYQAEIIRGAIASVGRGEILAGQTLGMTKRQVFFNIIFPQMIINAIPGWTNEVAVVLKDTSIGYVVGATEMLRQATYIASANKEYYFLILSVTGLIYLLLTYATSRALSRLDRHFRHQDNGGSRGKRTRKAIAEQAG